MKYLVEITTRFDKDDPIYLKEVIDASDPREAFLQSNLDLGDTPSQFVDINLNIHVTPHDKG